MNRTHRALVLAFVANGLGGPSFIARLAERQDALDLSDAGLGATVLGLGLGALLFSAPAGWLIHRVGSRRVTVTAGLVVGLTLWSAGAAGTAPVLFGALVVVGAADAAMDAAMNANGTAHEATTGRSVLHGLHGAWSFGALAGAGLAAAAASLDVSATVHLLAVGAVIVALSLASAADLVPTDPPPPPGDDDGGIPRRIPIALAVLGGATVAAAILEGTASDWSALQLDRLGASEGLAPLGLAAFTAGMVLGRLLGDRQIDRHGPAAVLRRGMVLCAVGLAGGVGIGEPLPFCIGVALAGYGLAGFFPMAFSASSRVPGVHAGTGTAAISLAARLGFIVEPVFVGTLAEATDLRVSFLAAAAVAAGVAIAAPRLVGPKSR